VVCLGGKGTGKTAIISQFLYDQYNTAYKETIEEMYRYCSLLSSKFNFRSLITNFHANFFGALTKKLLCCVVHISINKFSFQGRV
jgi:hypothetical protein